MVSGPWCKPQAPVYVLCLRRRLEVPTHCHCDYRNSGLCCPTGLFLYHGRNHQGLVGTDLHRNLERMLQLNHNCQPRAQGRQKDVQRRHEGIVLHCLDLHLPACNLSGSDGSDNLHLPSHRNFISA